MFNWGKKKTIDTDPQKIEELLSRSVASVYPTKEELQKVLQSGKRLRIYLGADATGSQLHIGHATNLILLERLRKLGHEIIFLFGDFTAMIGDPTGKEAARVQLTEKQVSENIEGWKEQVGKIMDLNDSSNPVRFEKNSKWLSKLDFSDLIKLASNFTVQQMLERDMFEKRLEEKKPIYLHEFFYPLMQGYDSVAMDVDMEVGGNDQTFNMLTGRTLQKAYNDKNKFVIATTLLVNPKTNKKLMNKSEGGYIALNDSSADVFGKTMALPDEAMRQVFIDCTYVPMKLIDLMKTELNPRENKITLAKALVHMLYDSETAEKEAENFIKTFSKGEVPEDVLEIKADKGSLLRDAIVSEKIVDSNGEWRRLVESNAVSFADTKESIADPFVKIDRDCIVRVGKKRFVKIIVRS